MPNATIAFVPTYIENAAMAVNDTSMPPEASTRRTPTAKIAVTMAFRSRSNRVGSERKLGSAKRCRGRQATSTRPTNVSFRARIRLQHGRSHPARRAASAVLFGGRAGDLLGSAARLHDENAIAERRAVRGCHQRSRSRPCLPQQAWLMMAWMSAFDPTSTPTVGSVEDQDPRRPRQPARQHHALLISAGEAAHRQAQRPASQHAAGLTQSSTRPRIRAREKCRQPRSSGRGC